MEVAAQKIIKEEYFRIAAVLDGLSSFKNIIVKASANKK
jgi:hypothetical protein